MKMNKILNGVLVSAMALSMVSSVSAVEIDFSEAQSSSLGYSSEEQILIEWEGNIYNLNLSEEFDRAKTGITDLFVENTEQIKLSIYNVSDSSVFPNIEEDVDMYTTTKILGINEESGSKLCATTTYIEVIDESSDVISRSYKDSNASNSKLYYITPYSTITWIDHFGTNNEFVSATGGWIMKNGATFIRGDAQIRERPNASISLGTDWGKLQEYSTASFYYGKSNGRYPTAFSFMLSTNGWYHVNGQTYHINFENYTSFFD